MRWMHRAQHRGSTTLRRPRKAPIWQLERRMCCPDVRKCVGTLMGAATRFGFVGRTSSRGRLKPGIDVYRGVNEVDQIRWADDRTLLLSLNAATDNNFVARITANGSAPPTFTTMQVPGRGYFLDVIPHDESHAVFVHADSGGTIHFFRIDLTAKKFDGLQFRGESRLDRGLKQPFFGLLDGEGVLRVAFVLADGDYALMYRADATAPWAEVRRFTADQTFDPLALSMDGRQLIARTDDGREQIDIVSINLPAGDVADTIFSTPGTDTEGAIISRDDRRVLAAFLYREGRQETAYVDKVSGALREMLQRALPDRDITVLDTSADRHAALVVASSETEPGTYYYLDVTAKHAKQLLTEYPADAARASGGIETDRHQRG